MLAQLARCSSRWWHHDDRSRQHRPRPLPTIGVFSGAPLPHARAEMFMTQLTNRHFAHTGTLSSSTARWAIATALFGAGTLSCSTPDNPTGTGGQGGVGGTGGASVTGGAGGTGG